MKLNTVIRLPDGRVGTMVYHWLDGDGGVFGEHWFPMPSGGFGDELPKPEFFLRDRSMVTQLPLEFPNAEFLGEPKDVAYEIVRLGDDGRKDPCK